MKKMILALVILAVTVPAQVPSVVEANSAVQQPAITAAHKEDVKKLIEILGLKDMMPQMVKPLIGSMFRGFVEGMKRKGKELDQKQVDVVKRVLISEMQTIMTKYSPHFIEATAELYANNFNHKEVKDLLAFYESDTGKKSIALMPKLRAIVKSGV